ncbi:hypothetical protein VR41_08110 [Streptomyces sp. NRRL B-1568]|nr:hypothetical protein VR41_08110 [Streptomyces sp. NRRL B-1568]
MTAALAAALVLSAAPSALATSTGAVSAGAKPKGPKHFDLSNKDNSTSISVHKGDEITVRLAGEQKDTSTWAWSEPTAADGAVLQRSGAGTSPNGDSTAVFHARADGTTTLDSQLRCVSRKSGQTCSHVVVPWQATVKVKERKRR